MKCHLLALIGIVLILIISGCTQTGQITSNQQPVINQEVRVCESDWECTNWSLCSLEGEQTRICADLNECKVTQNIPDKQKECIPPAIKTAELTINKVQVMAANLYPIRITVENTGNVKFCPNFDIYAFDLEDNQKCSGSPMIGMECVYPGKKKTDEIMILSCMFREDGTYILQIDLLDEDYNVIDSKQKPFEVDYWNAFMI